MWSYSACLIIFVQFYQYFKYFKSCTQRKLEWELTTASTEPIGNFAQFLLVVLSSWDSVVCCSEVSVSDFLTFDTTLWAGWLTPLERVSRGFRAELIVLAMYGLDRSRLWGSRARSVTKPFLSRDFTMLFMTVCWPLNIWLGTWPPGLGHESMIILIKLVRARILVCLRALSGRARALCSAPLISVTRVIWASGLWLQDAMLAINTRDRAGQSRSPNIWHWGRRLSNTNANTVHSYNNKSIFHHYFTTTAHTICLMPN